MDRSSYIIRGFPDLIARLMSIGACASFRDWSAERTRYPQEVCEKALAHAVKSKAEAAYRRGDLLENRRDLMAEWSAYLGS